MTVSKLQEMTIFITMMIYVFCCISLQTKKNNISFFVPDYIVLTVGFGRDGVFVDESTGEFRMCVVKDRVALQDVTVTIASQPESASPDLGE